MTMTAQCPAVLFVIFNRPATTLRVFEAIKKAQPSQLFIAADGPRYPLKNEFSLCRDVRAIAELVDWPCEVHTLFQDTNLGCGRGVSTALDWFFSKIEEGIILEDDCLPSDDFFTFCAQGLAQYRQDERVTMITGTNYLLGKYAQWSGHYLSKHYPIWGWATWRRAWQLYRYDLSSWDSELSIKELRGFFGNVLIAKKWAQQFDQVKHRLIDTWDIQWVFACVKARALCATPLQNLVSNIDPGGAHGNGIRVWVHGMLYQEIDKAQCWRESLSENSCRKLDLETYANNGFLYREPIFKASVRSIFKRAPLLKKIVIKAKFLWGRLI
jgi:hypothetical protein